VKKKTSVIFKSHTLQRCLFQKDSSITQSVHVNVEPNCSCNTAFRPMTLPALQYFVSRHSSKRETARRRADDDSLSAVLSFA